VRQRLQRARRGGSASGRSERHHRVDDVEGPRAGERRHLPAIGQSTPAAAHVDVSELEPPQQRRGIGERIHVQGIGDLRIVGRERGFRAV
jgi:hypothetical protein